MLPISWADDTSKRKSVIDRCLQGAGGIVKGLLKAQPTLLGDVQGAGNNISPTVPVTQIRSAMEQNQQEAF